MTEKALAASRANWQKAIAVIKSRPKQRVQIACLECGLTFEVEPYRRDKAKTCSVTCRQIHNGRFSGEPQRHRGNGKSYTKWHGTHMHRVAMERKIGRKLKRGEVVHHINGNRTDNRIENLQLLSGQSEHIKLHNAKRKAAA